MVSFGARFQIKRRRIGAHLIDSVAFNDLRARRAQAGYAGIRCVPTAVAAAHCAVLLGPRRCGLSSLLRGQSADVKTVSAMSERTGLAKSPDSLLDAESVVVSLEDIDIIRETRTVLREVNAGRGLHQKAESSFSTK